MLSRPTIRTRLIASAALGALTLLAACDDDDPVGVDDEQEFVATLMPLNGSGVTGTAAFLIDNGQLVADVDAAGLAPNMIHAQHIHFAASCPTAAQDTNNDNFIDVLEGVPAYGRILVPLDSELAQQMPGTFPTASAAGVITYAQAVALNTLLSDLRAPDPNPDDAIVKLESNGELNLEGRTVVLHGVAPETNLPSSVQTLPGLTPQQSLPVACGTIDAI